MDHPVETNWVVCAGVPFSGKTTTINQLQNAGYFIIPEVARAYIEEQHRLGVPMDVIRSPEGHNKISRLKEASEAGLNPQEILFLDGALPDRIGRKIARNEEVQESDWNDVTRYSYKLVFIFDPLSDYKPDTVRTSTPSHRLRLNETIAEGYEVLNHNIIRVPVMAVEDRMKFIMEKCRAHIPNFDTLARRNPEFSAEISQVHNLEI